ncbi:[protein-PII] uridylyltransferase [Candidatus Thiodiazotropha sp. CDECU1]|uniref:[protein-PII] uridylyltransferase n=1 Tax=Candidatus Thiodiazotropha sp. CDECU1 TaxID=3065865 RepID=UPI00292FF1C8|nr:[protein-PII] uridylyltransferase [Candidatus Thiodiazotropha sp. CDECU1]
MIDFSALNQAFAEDGSPIQPCKVILKHYTEGAKQRFSTGQTPISKLVAERALMIDEILIRAWNRYLDTSIDACLVAVGGYGRGELHPASDIDLLILLDHEDQFESFKDSLTEFLTLLWDIGLDVGHSVRTIDDCVREGDQDITVMTNLIESRSLVGSTQLFTAMLEATGPERMWNSHDFFEAKWNEQRIRHAKQDDTISNLEPNIKESPGGLRDIHMIGWVAKRHFKIDNLHDLVEHAFLTEAEYHTLIEGQEHLWRVRFALHLLTGRHDDRLLFDHQRTLASYLGYDADHANMAVEFFMRDYYRTVMELSRLNEMLLQHFQEDILFKNELGDPIEINKRFQKRGYFLEVTHKNIFKNYPTALLELFLVMQENPELRGVRASTIRLIRNHTYLIDEKFRQDIRAKSLFMEILRQPVGITSALRRMNIYGVLAVYIPIFENIVGRMQYDLFHVYTVDEHTLMVVRNLRRLTTKKYADEHPVCTQLMNTLPKEEIIYLAALFHDIAKGRGGNHSELGAIDAYDFCRLHQLSEYDSHLVAWLVRHHLVMSMTAQRKDITDPEVVQSFASLVGDINRLTYLYLLTFADSRATNPAAWNSWKDSLLRDLFNATRRALLRGLDNPLAQDDLIREKQTAALHQLLQQNISSEDISNLWTTFTKEYFLTHSPNAIKRHTKAIIETPNSDLPLIQMRQTEKRGGSEVLIYCLDRDNLFAVTTTMLDQLALSIVNARVMSTTDGFSLNSYLVLEQDGSPVEIGRRSDEIITTLSDGLSLEGTQPFKVSRRIPRKNKHFDNKTSIYFTQEPKLKRTAMRLVTMDRPGLLSNVGRAFAECKIRLKHSKITTLGAQVEDIFFITDRDDRPILDEDRLNCLRSTVTQKMTE